MPSNPTQLTSQLKREQALADLERISAQWQADSDVFTQVSRKMATTLDLRTLLAIFAEEMLPHVAFDRVVYNHTVEGMPIHISIGKGGNHRCEYRLNLEGACYGDLRIFRRHRFAEQELRFIEQLLSIAIHPIRNAIRFETVQRAALTDVVTGIPNKRAFEDALEREASLGNRHGDSCALILCDLDHFKSINDTFGHKTGDDILRAVALSLQDATRTSDLVYRIGGEEFAIILPRVNAKEAIVVVDRIRKTIETISIETASGKAKVTSSAGVAIRATGEPADPWFCRADKALYNAKNKGRNCTRQALPGLDSDVTPIRGGRRS